MSVDASAMSLFGASAPNARQESKIRELREALDRAEARLNEVMTAYRDGVPYARFMGLEEAPAVEPRPETPPAPPPSAPEPKPALALDEHAREKFHDAVDRGDWPEAQIWLEQAGTLWARDLGDAAARPEALVQTPPSDAQTPRPPVAFAVHLYHVGMYHLNHSQHYGEAVSAFGAAKAIIDRYAATREADTGLLDMKLNSEFHAMLASAFAQDYAKAAAEGAALSKNLLFGQGYSAARVADLKGRLADGLSEYFRASDQAERVKTELAPVFRLVQGASAGSFMRLGATKAP